MNRTTRPLALILPALAVLGCTPKAPPPVAGEVPGVRCDANALAGLKGRKASEIGAEALRLSGARSMRSYGPGDAVTMDYRGDRLNIETDAAGVAVRFTCG